uniref:F-actin monooxygenase n=1 Tax=Sander lucioperca TaxID=283035 RepID=A0A8D0CQ54_SANLU
KQEPQHTKPSTALFENFVQASTCKGALQAFNVLCRRLDLDPAENDTFYSRLKAKATSWKAKALWSKLDKRMSHKEYKKGQACVGTKCLIIGGGPCGLRTAIELALMGAKVVVIEKRDSFSRNNVLHLWPYTIHDLRGLGAKKFYGKFCAGAIDHISIQKLQLVLLKVALIVAVEFHINVEFVKLLEPPEDQENEGLGWRAAIRPADHPVANFEFDVVVGADGRRNTLEGFKRKEFRGKLAIAITANFINRNTTAEAKVEEISGVAFIFNQKFFLDLKEETGIDLENIVYYKDNTHYFVMTAKKQSLLDKGVVINDYIDTQMLLSSENVNQEALLCYAREAADFGTNYQLPTLDFAMNHCGQPDVAMFDFTSMYASENAALVRERFGHQLLVALVGDSLLEPFWPMGTGCARGFLAAFDTAWMVRSWAQGRTAVEVLAERESIYRLLPQTTTENIGKNFDQYTIDPGTRYPNLNSSCVRPHQVRGTRKYMSRQNDKDMYIPQLQLLTWCQKQTEGYKNVMITDLTSSWKSGIALCALIHRFKPQLIDFDSLKEEDHCANLQLAFDISEREFGIGPFTSVKELSDDQELDKTRMITYLSKFYELFRGTPLPASVSVKDFVLSRCVTLIFPVFLFHRRCLSSVSQGGSLRRAFPPSGDQCHSCERRVYMVERVCAEGLYFHRECFRCSTCSSALRQGAHAFDSEQGKLYCKLHFDQRNSGTNLRRTFSVRSVSTLHFQQYPSHPSNIYCKISNSSVLCLRIVLELEFRSDVLTTDRAQSPAAQQTCRVNPQQVPSARS